MRKNTIEPFIIRTATSNDAQAIAEIHILGWQTTYRGHMPDDVLNGLSLIEREQQWRERLEKLECEALGVLRMKWVRRLDFTIYFNYR